MATKKSTSKSAPKKSTAKKPAAKKTTTTTRKTTTKPAAKKQVVKQTEVNIYNTEVPVVFAMAAVAVMMFIAYLIINSAL